MAKIILISVIRAADHYKSTYVLALSFLVIQTAFSVWSAWTLVAVYQRFSPSGEAAGSSASSATVTGLVVLVIFAYYWTSELIKAIAYTSVSGIFGVWYYNQGPDPRHVAMSSLRRCLTYSFGSLCFGSLILAILDIIRAIVYQVQQQQAQEGDMIGFAIACVAGCIIGCIDWLITFFNRLAYTNIALYGNSFLTASKETWQLVKQKGIDALINDSLINKWVDAATVHHSLTDFKTVPPQRLGVWLVCHWVGLWYLCLRLSFAQQPDVRSKRLELLLCGYLFFVRILCCTANVDVMLIRLIPAASDWASTSLWPSDPARSERAARRCSFVLPRTLPWLPRRILSCSKHCDKRILVRAVFVMRRSTALPSADHLVLLSLACLSTEVIHPVDH